MWEVAGLPMLLECDGQGRIVRLGERARSIVAPAESLVEALWSTHFNRTGLVRFFGVLRDQENTVVGAEVWEAAAPGRQDLRHLETRFLGHYFRLHGIERRLTESARRKKRSGGRSAVRQIELERQRLGRELHTGIGQMLAAMRLQAEFVGEHMPEPGPPLRQALQNMAALVDGALDQVRSISRRLYPPEWQRLTIGAALRQLWEVSGIPLQFEARLDLHALEGEPDPEIKSLLYRTAQEGLSNIIRHARAHMVAMSLETFGDRLVLTLQDDGVGFDAATLTRVPVHGGGGIGLRSIEELAATLGAKIRIATGPNGTKLVLSTPLTVGL